MFIKQRCPSAMSAPRAFRCKHVPQGRPSRLSRDRGPQYLTLHISLNICCIVFIVFIHSYSSSRSLSLSEALPTTAIDTVHSLHAKGPVHKIRHARGGRGSEKV